MKDIPKIMDVMPLDDMIIMVTFDNHITKKYDMKMLLDRFPVFEELKNSSIFNLVHVDCGGYGIAWNDEIDLSEYEIWNNGEQIM